MRTKRVGFKPPRFARSERRGGACAERVSLNTVRCLAAVSRTLRAGRALRRALGEDTPQPQTKKKAQMELANDAYCGAAKTTTSGGERQ